MKRFILMLLFLCGMGLIAYSFLWFSYKAEIERTLRDTIITATKAGVSFQGKFDPVTGFPGSYKTAFSGTVSYRQYDLDIPHAEIQSFFLPHTAVSLSLPHGAEIKGTPEPELNSIDALSVTAIIPEQLPSGITKPEITAWQTAGGALEIKHYSLEKETLRLEGSGRFLLSEERQPEGKFSAAITGGIPFVGWLKDQDIIESKDALIASAVMSGLSKEDPDTGERVIKAEITLQNGILFLGPLRLLEVPLIDWPSLPAQAVPVSPAPPQ